MSSEPLNLVGKRYGRLLVTEYLGLRKRPDGRNYSWVRCICDCGNVIEKKSTSLTSSHVRSCGCLRREITRNKSTYHGYSHTKLYGVWQAMKSRCNKQSDPAYHNYGGRGISYTPEWDDYMNFHKWAYENGYKQDSGLTLERNDVNGDYTPENCCWADRKRQSNNKRNNLFFTMDGETHTLAEWCAIYKVPYGRVDVRINKLGWSFEKALFTENKCPMHTITYKGETKTTKEWAEITGLTTTLIRTRLKKGWTPEEILETPKMSNGGNSEWRKIHKLQRQTQH